MPQRTNRADIARLEDLPNIGPSIAQDLRLLKIKAPTDLLGRDPYQMYEDLCALTGHRHDPCLLDTFIAVTDFMSGAPAKPWWKYTAGRKKKTAAESRRSFLKASLAIASVAIFAGQSKVAQAAEAAQAAETGPPLMAYVGTFSSPLRDVLPTQVDLPPGNGRGIHLFQVDRETGAMTPAGIQELGTSPSCLAINAAGTRLYSANETDRSGPDIQGTGKQGTVSAFAIGKSDGKLTALNSVPSGGAGPTNVSIHPSGKFLLIANYFGGSVAVLPIMPDGRLGTATDIKTDAGNIGPAKPTHAPPGSFAFSGHDRTHAHQVAADPSGKFVLHAELGLDTIYVWKFDDQNGVLSPGEQHAVPFPPGDGPRHFHFHSNGRWLYVLTEEASNIVLFDYEAGHLSARQTISTLPPGFAGSSFASEILVSADGRFVYAGNRLHDSIAFFSIGPDGTLTYVGEEWTRGNYPRSFSFDPTGRFLFCCNQRADNVAIFRVDQKAGALTFTGNYAAVGNPSMITFLDLGKVK
ncbi:MAG TPA: beta-propeller fold lactonase family protein [Humisphaera sp.]|jgi:6-phosphogluconolactonase (cycloisomerase 2 family)|nr:beta-propeller fold lactonase family protein [Humisphaera sp.]